MNLKIDIPVTLSHLNDLHLQELKESLMQIRRSFSVFCFSPEMRDAPFSNNLAFAQLMEMLGYNNKHVRKYQSHKQAFLCAISAAWREYYKKTSRPTPPKCVDQLCRGLWAEFQSKRGLGYYDRFEVNYRWEAIAKIDEGLLVYRSLRAKFIKGLSPVKPSGSKYKKTLNLLEYAKQGDVIKFLHSYCLTMNYNYNGQTHEILSRLRWK